MSIIKLNLGCGPSGINGWDNLDWGLLPLLNKLGLTKLLVDFGLLNKGYLIKWPKFRLADIRRSLPVASDSVDFVYCSHVLEHFERVEGLTILSEIWRVLKPGAMARLVLPSTSKMVKNYSDPNVFNEQFWGYDKQSLTGLKRLFIRGHQWMYDEKSFAKLLVEAGFVEPRLVEFRKGKTPDLNKLDLAGYSNISMYFEVTKN